jgi:hypothetical protein
MGNRRVGRRRQAPEGVATRDARKRRLGGGRVLPTRFEGRIAEVFFGIVAEENHPVGPQSVERILKFRKSAIDVGERHRCQVAETIGPPGHEIPRVFVDPAGHLSSLALDPTDDTWRGQREDSGRDLLGVHQIDRALGRPLRKNGAREIAGPWARAYRLR